jgi:pyruvate/2-oxoglutarate dehydrogenase complex dihydrolipoamide acyltransferase (E2) component
MKSDREGYTVESIPKMRRFALDAGYLGRRRHIVHGLIEVDVTEARNFIEAHERRTGEKLSFTAFIIFCLGKAVEENPHMHAYRNWRNQLVIFEDININTMVEIEKGGRKIPLPHIFKAVNQKSYLDIHNEIRATKQRPEQTLESTFMEWFLVLPAFLRRLFYWVVMRIPQVFRKYSSSVMVTAVGMFGRGGGWGITLPNFTLTVTVGGIARKPGVVEERIEIREYLALTISIDHDVVDGAPMVRFVNYFKELIESGYGLVDLPSPA